MHHADSCGLVKMINTITIFRMMESKRDLRRLPPGSRYPGLVSQDQHSLNGKICEWFSQCLLLLKLFLIGLNCFTSFGMHAAPSL